MRKNKDSEDLFSMPTLPTANSLTRAVFEKGVDFLRQVHSCALSSAYKMMEECSCPECPGLGSGKPSTLHIAEQEIDAGLKAAKDKAVDGVPDLSALRAYAGHLMNYLRVKIGEECAENLHGEAARKAVLGKVIAEHTDILLSNLNRDPDDKQLSEAEQLCAAVELYADLLRTEIRLKRRKQDVDASKGHLRRA